MSRSTVNFAVASLSFLNLLALAFTGYVMRYVLPPGTGCLGQSLHGGRGRGINVKELWSMTRHEWGSIHFYLAVAFVVLVFIHIVLHWKWIKCYMKTFAKK